MAMVAVDREDPLSRPNNTQRDKTSGPISHFSEPHGHGSYRELSNQIQLSHVLSGDTGAREPPKVSSPRNSLRRLSQWRSGSYGPKLAPIEPHRPPRITVTDQDGLEPSANATQITTLLNGTDASTWEKVKAKSKVHFEKVRPFTPNWRPLQTLDKQLRSSLKTSGFNRRKEKFLPIAEFDKHVLEAAVRAELRRHESISIKRSKKCKRTLTQKVQYIFGKVETSARTGAGSSHVTYPAAVGKRFVKIFAILLLIKRERKIEAFLHKGFCDSQLPLRNLEQCLGPGWEQGLNEEELSDFEKAQWQVLAPDFSWNHMTQAPHFDFCPETIMPFLKYELMHRSGSFGQVNRVTLDPSHHDYTKYKGTNSVFAIKWLKSDKEEVFNREVKILRRLSREQNRHAHLIQLLASYKFEGHNHLVFPWAESDLMAYWKEENPRPASDSARAQWLAQQCQGLAEALGKIQRYLTSSASSLRSAYTASKNSTLHPVDPPDDDVTSTTQIIMYGHHCDIKPENILWFEREGKYGTLKLTDFGISHYDTQKEVLAQESNVIPNSGTYRAPECHDDEWVLKTSYDIWALGCVYLDFVTWFFHGAKGLQDFAKERLVFDPTWPSAMQTDTFFTSAVDDNNERQTQVKSAVTQMFDNLRPEAACMGSFRSFFEKFLDLLEEKMVIVEPRDRDEHTGGRISSHNAAIKIAEIMPPHTALELYRRQTSIVNSTGR